MNFPEEYSIALTEHEIERHFPNLSLDNFKFTSLQTDEYNCVAWVIDKDDDWIQFYYDNGNNDVRVSRYIEYFNSLGFTISNNPNLQEGVIKIAVYSDDSNEFKHVARQLPNGKWTSKLGDWEDIEHETAEVLLGKSYGSRLTIMERKQNHTV
jgi:hypothetical protein